MWFDNEGFLKIDSSMGSLLSGFLLAVGISGKEGGD